MDIIFKNNSLICNGAVVPIDLNNTDFIGLANKFMNNEINLVRNLESDEDYKKRIDATNRGIVYMAGTQTLVGGWSVIDRLNPNQIGDIIKTNVTDNSTFKNMSDDALSISLYSEIRNYINLIYGEDFDGDYPALEGEYKLIGIMLDGLGIARPFSGKLKRNDEDLDKFERIKNFMRVL